MGKLVFCEHCNAYWNEVHKQVNKKLYLQNFKCSYPLKVNNLLNWFFKVKLIIAINTFQHVPGNINVIKLLNIFQTMNVFYFFDLVTNDSICKVYITMLSFIFLDNARIFISIVGIDLVSNLLLFVVKTVKLIY